MKGEKNEKRTNNCYNHNRRYKIKPLELKSRCYDFYFAFTAVFCSLQQTNRTQRIMMFGYGIVMLTYISFLFCIIYIFIQNIFFWLDNDIGDHQ